MAKGIRVNQLAKELGVESKAILRKLTDEGLGDRAPNHMSVLPLGLAESVREWFSSGSGGTAVETAAPVDVAVKPKRSRVAPRKSVDAGEEPIGSDETETSSEDAPETHVDVPAVVVEPPTPVAEPPAPPVAAAVPAPVEAEARPAAKAPPVAAEVPAAQPAPAVIAPPAPVVHSVPHVPPPPVAPRGPSHPAHAPAAASAPPTTRPSHADAVRPVAQRPTVTLGPSRAAGPAGVERKAVAVAPKLQTLRPASIQGPSIVRVEAPENLPAPRARRPGGPGGGETTGPAVFRPQTGRGVRVVDDDEEEKKKAAAKSGRTNSGRRRGPDGRRGEAEEKLREFTEADLLERQERLQEAGRYHHGMEERFRRSGQRGHQNMSRADGGRGPVQIEEPITIKGLSAVLGVKSTDILRKLFMQGVHGVNINSNLDADTAQAMGLEYGVELEVKQQATMEEELLEEFSQREPQEGEALEPRPAVVTILGHVDHGKTSLLDRIRSANVAAGEAGGITQHTAAWMVEVKRGETTKRVTFIDTPGHQAFTSMRARGAQVTDVVVLVVSAAEGVQPQTVESINHARAAGVPIVVALNKIDRPDANPDMVLGQLAKENLNPVEWGGDTEVVRTSATTGQGITDLIDILDYQAELLELKANPSAPARGTVIESRVDAGLGPIATVLVQDGTLKVGDVILSGPGYGRIRSLLNDRLEMIPQAAPATPVIVSGLGVLPASGDKFYVVEDMERARSIAEERQLLSRQTALSSRTQVSLANLNDKIREGATKTINLIIKGDVHGSVETLAKTVTEQNTEEVRVRVIHAAVGGITESDVELADASDAVVIGFNVVPDEAARGMAEHRHVEIRLYRIIYEIFDDLKKALSGMLEPEIREKLHGHLEVRQVFKVSRIGNIAGCFCTDGHIQRGSKIRLTRDGRVLVEDLSIESLKRLKDDVREVKSGFECGVKLAGYDDIKTGDIMEAYIRETFQRTL